MRGSFWANSLCLAAARAAQHKKNDLPGLGACASSMEKAIRFRVSGLGFVVLGFRGSGVWGLGFVVLVFRGSGVWGLGLVRGASS